MKNKPFYFSLFVGSCLIITVLLIIQQYQSAFENSKVYASTNLPTSSIKLPGKEITEKITVGAIGDVLIHDWIYNDAKRGNSYDFHPIFQNVKGMLQKPALVTANQESILGGKALGISGYPEFNSPQEVADAVMDSGVDIVSTANNHSYDKGERGIQSQSNYLDKIGLKHVGSFTSEKDRNTLRVIESHGIKVAFLAYTFGTNGIRIPANKSYLVNIINKDLMKKEISRARLDADVVIMSIHWGKEYERYPSAAQKELAHFLANEGVDIIFGSHPHVLQPMEWITARDGRKVLAVYSLGNFLSGQVRDYKDIGGLATVDITKSTTKNGNKIQLSNPLFYPTYVTQKHFKLYKVVPLEKAASFGLSHADVKYREIQAFMKQWIH
ncbi:MAG: CapA family protein [Bacillota bacterium]|nr:CapA family protein [Bacillota bacterium]